MPSSDLHPNAYLSVFLRFVLVCYFNVFYTRLILVRQDLTYYAEPREKGSAARPYPQGSAPLATTHTVCPCQQLVSTCQSPVAQRTPLIANPSERSYLQRAKSYSAQLVAQCIVAETSTSLPFSLHHLFLKVRKAKHTY